MPGTNLGSLSVEALLKLRDDVGRVLSQRAGQLKDQLSRLGEEVGEGRRGRAGGLKGRKVAAKYRDKEGHTWAGRGAQPVCCERSSRRALRWKTLPYKRRRLPAKLRRRDTRSDASQSDGGFPALIGCRAHLGLRPSPTQSVLRLRDRRSDRIKQHH
jgi:H-NS histone family